jgi:hypothetical protein
MHVTDTRRSDLRAFAVALSALSLSACGGGTARTPSPATVAPSPAPEAEWQALATPRPAPLPGAPRIALAMVEVNAPTGSLAPLATPGLGLSELVTAGLLRRQDVSFVERRRFAVAAEAERQGRPRAPGAPPAGVSSGADLILGATWSSLGSVARLDVTLVDAATGAVVGKRALTTPGTADPTAVARSVVGSALAVLDDLGRRPAWNDPEPGLAPASYRPSGVPAAAVDAFMRGLAAEDLWKWDAARVGYQAALEAGGAGFPEARVALARAARLRLGGTLGAS